MFGKMIKKQEIWLSLQSKPTILLRITPLMRTGKYNWKKKESLLRLNFNIEQTDKFS